MAYESEMELELEEELGGLGEFEQQEGEWEQPELTQEFEADQFFGRAFRGIGRFVRRAAPLLRNVARVAAPLVGTAIGGPFGAILGRVASSALGEEEFEHPGMAHEFEHPGMAHEFEHPEMAQEFEHPEMAQEFEHPEMAQEFEHPGMAHELEMPELESLEGSQEIANEIAQHELTHHQALARL